VLGLPQEAVCLREVFAVGAADVAAVGERGERGEGGSVSMTRRRIACASSTKLSRRDASQTSGAVASA
jgi:hypothetical protein